MLRKIALGTANFSQPYGIFSEGRSLDEKSIQSIFKTALANGIDTFDTASAYGNPFDCLEDKSFVKDLNVITKFSVLDDYRKIQEELINLKDILGIDSCYGLLVHDPQNIEKADKIELLYLFDNLRSMGVVKKIGVSIYDIHDLDNFQKIVTPDLVQIPLNPLNQKFISEVFQERVCADNIEIHARSLFLQGVLLSPELPKSLKPLEPLWTVFTRLSKMYGSRLEALLSWAQGQKWVHKWVLGVASVTDLLEIIKHSQGLIKIETPPCFEELRTMFDPLVDPRNWNMS